MKKPSEEIQEAFFFEFKIKSTVSKIIVGHSTNLKTIKRPSSKVTVAMALH
jgi:hypothetical protein